MSEYMANKQLCPDCDGEGGSYASTGTGEEDFFKCHTCDGEGYVPDEDVVAPIHYKEQDEFDASKEQDIKDSLRGE